jgi:hypothetical protein
METLIEKKMVPATLGFAAMLIASTALAEHEIKGVAKTHGLDFDGSGG